MRTPTNEDQKRLLQILNDSPTIVKLTNGTEYKIKALKIWTRQRIAEIATHMKDTNPDADSVIISMASNIPCMTEIIALLILNEKARTKSVLSKMIRTIEDEIDSFEDWSTIMLHALKLLDVDFFFQLTKILPTFQEIVTKSRNQE